MPVSAQEGWEWHCREGALERLIPAWEDVTITRKDIPVFKTGSQVDFLLRTGPFTQRWLAEHTTIDPGKSFTDKMVVGPLQYWLHTHRFHEIDDKSFELEDTMEYRLPLYLAMVPGGSAFARQRLQSLFAYRHRLTCNDLKCIHSYPTNRCMRILVSGASGFIGSALLPFLGTGCHEVWRLVRTKDKGPRDIYWNPETDEIEQEMLEGFDVVIHLAGENIFGYWNQKKKDRIRNSRVHGTQYLVDRLNELENPPKTFLCGSAVGYYGDRGSAAIDEDTEKGTGFLADVCEEWERAARSYEKGRVVNLRTGVVLSPGGGALGKMLLPFKLGLGGTLGWGAHYFPWISLDDWLYQTYHVMMTEAIEGPVNMVAPQALTNKEFTKALGKVLWRPTILPVPYLPVKLLLGEMVDETLFASGRAKPGRLEQTGARFAYPDIISALKHLLGK